MRIMKKLSTLSSVLGIVAVVVFSGCAATAEAEDAPTVFEDSIDEADIGTSWNGWDQSIVGTTCVNANLAQVSHTFVRSSGDATRGGGVCGTIVSSTACTTVGDDSFCLGMAHALYGQSAYGYCHPVPFSGPKCLYRPGSQADYCSLSPNRGAGTVSKTINDKRVNYMVGCMTKTAGPNTACGGTNQGLYMRHATNTQGNSGC
jgi:hypothetical protein